MRQGDMKGLAQTVRGWIVAPGFRPPESIRAQVIEATLTLDGMLTPEQRGHVVATIDDWSAKLRKVQR
jgi:hypothetical protein